jgi:hypothetical protein
MFAVSGNKTYRIDEDKKETYLARGYDVTDDDGAIIAHNPDKKVAYAKYVEIMSENERLKAELARKGKA